MKLLPLLLVLLLAACAPNVRPDSYGVGAVGQVNRTVSGVIVSARLVSIDGTQGGGAVAGAGMGSLAGSSLGGSGRANAAGAIGGMVVGAIAGAAAERGVSRTQGREYVVQTENGNLMTIVQGADPELPVGQRVLVLYGSPARVIVDPR
ncbi:MULTISPECIES: outer membrane lipoprotein [Xanthomonas]|uniref:Glycine zipper 2TM domain-containing protein n=2 Tax=Xanthomonas citri TaxID=346 RepID=A0AB33CC37_XANCI|nr:MULTISPECIES: hypothetical protein [Xanthomonas]MBV6780942.1 hypothetical protein [Xanthomonas campestris pv. trichodesmae]ASK91859.1 hypothetical protein XcvCFBP7111P_10380 [Xanthomonas citri pv. vignicola]MBV6788466.1 hypothetical protein [Xanthomonas campestris pv. clerodendri]MBZ3919218.1 hypothetical protein [Xanthomonas campestris pv. trichodesmae]MBZ3922901.1 hypothetical protein [Xanthomonas citri pv. sesbaniae]